MYEYFLYINGVHYETFNRIKDIDLFLFENNLEYSNNHIEVKRFKKIKKKVGK